MPAESADLTSFLINTASSASPSAPARDPAAPYIDDLQDAEDLDHDHGNEHFEPVSRFGQFIYLLGIIGTALGPETKGKPLPE